MTTNPEQQQPTSRREMLVVENLRHAKAAGVLVTTLDVDEGPVVCANLEPGTTDELVPDNYSHRSAAQERADFLKRELRVAAEVVQSGVFFFVTLEVPREICEKCDRILTEANVVDLEHSVDDGCYYRPGELPEGHESQGIFFFGRDCAEAELARTIREYEDPWGGRPDPSSMTDDELHEETISLAEAMNTEGSAWSDADRASFDRRSEAITAEIDRREEAGLPFGDGIEAVEDVLLLLAASGKEITVTAEDARSLARVLSDLRLELDRTEARRVTAEETIILKDQRIQELNEETFEAQAQARRRGQRIEQRDGELLALKQKYDDGVPGGFCGSCGEGLECGTCGYGDNMDEQTCADCGAKGKLTGHMDCPEPGRVSDERSQ